MLKIIIIALAYIGLLGCADQSVDKFKEKAKAESEAEKEVNNKNIDERAQRMENDLQKRFRFYNGVSNNYIGYFKINGNAYQMKVEMFSSIHVIESDRVRTVEEIQDDMNNLHLNAQVVIWDKNGSIGAKGCVFSNIKPDIMNGVIQLISNECPNRYTMYVGIQKSSRTIAKSLMNGNMRYASSLYLDVSSQFNVNGYSVIIKKQ